jgi:ribonuclease J
VNYLFEFDLLPPVDVLYSEEARAGSDLKYQPPQVHGVFVSHAHMDHAGHLGLIDPTIPVFVADGTRRLLNAIETCGSQKYGEHDWRHVDDGKGVKVGQVEVVPLPVDHSIPSAYGFVIHTSAGTVVYTGDFRMHGPRASATHEFVNRASEEKPEALVMEGTRAGPDPRKNFSEDGVRTSVDDLLGSTGLPALVGCYPREVDRLTTL